MTTENNVLSGEHAVVVGGSMAGLPAARVLSDHFGRVTLIERDRLPGGAESRKGVPQDRHAHALLARGGIALEKMFPGIVGEPVSDGATAYDGAAENRWYQRGGYRARFETGRPSVLMSRPLLEGRVRRRVGALENVTVRPESVVTGLTAAPGRVTGVSLRQNGAADGETLPADLVGDAGGRGSRAPAWLEALGYGRPPEEEIRIGVGYTTRLYRRRPGDLPGARLCIIQPTPPHEKRMGAMFQIEGGRWLVTLGGWLGEQAPADEEGFVEFARNLPAPDIYDVIKDAEALGGAVEYNFPANVRRRYEQLNEVPEGYLVTGDALCCFNPIYGQGMSVAALEAETLDACLGEGRGDLPRRFYRRVSKVVDVPWRLAAGADLAHPGVTGCRGRATGAINWYVGHVQRAANRDPRVCRALIMVTGLLAPPAALFHPAVVLRVLRHTLARQWRTKDPQKPEALAPGAA